MNQKTEKQQRKPMKAKVDSLKRIIILTFNYFVKIKEGESEKKSNY